MKKIEVIVKKSKFKDVKEELHKAGLIFFCYWDVTGSGNEIQKWFYRSISYTSSEIQKRWLSIVVANSLLDKTVEVLLNSAHTGRVGDGKIFVSNIQESFRIRTIEDGYDALI